MWVSPALRSDSGRAHGALPCADARPSTARSSESPPHGTARTFALTPPWPGLLPAVRQGLLGLRLAAAALAAPGHLRAADGAVGGGAARGVPRSRGGAGSTPGSEAGSRITALFERVVIDWLKETESRLWGTYVSVGWARKARLAWATSKLEPTVRAARMVRKHLDGGVDEREDPADQGDGLRIPEKGALPQRKPLPPRGTWSLPEARFNPHNFLKRHFFHQSRGLIDAPILGI